MEMEMENPFKKVSVIPNEKDFADAIVYRIQHQSLVKPLLTKSCSITSLRNVYKRNVWCLCSSFTDKLRRVTKEFPPRLVSRNEVHYAREAMRRTAKGFMQLLWNEDCDSLYKFKRVLVSALGCMFTIAMKIMPILTYLEDVRQFMASRTESKLENYYDDFLVNPTLTKTRYLAEEAAKEFPLTVDVQDVDNFVDPKVMTWLEELEREHGFRFEDDQLHFAKLSHYPKKNVQALVT